MLVRGRRSSFRDISPQFQHFDCTTLPVWKSLDCESERLRIGNMSPLWNSRFRRQRLRPNYRQNSLSADDIRPGGSVGSLCHGLRADITIPVRSTVKTASAIQTLSTARPSADREISSNNLDVTFAGESGIHKGDICRSGGAQTRIQTLPDGQRSAIEMLNCVNVPEGAAAACGTSIGALKLRHTVAMTAFERS